MNLLFMKMFRSSRRRASVSPNGLLSASRAVDTSTWTVSRALVSRGPPWGRPRVDQRSCPRRIYMPRSAVNEEIRL